MKKALIQYSLAFAAALSLALLASSPARAQSTAFTYQGLLDDAGAPTSGLHDFRFRLFDAASGGAQLGSTLCADNVDVVEGVFTAQIDFGQQFATTAQRHLEIEVRRDTGLTCANAAGFVVLAPRQQLTAAPLAIHANSAFALDAADGSPASAVFVDNSGNVGIGTTSPQAPLHVNGSLRWGGTTTDFGYSGEDASGLFLEQKGSSSATSKIRLQTSKSGDASNYSQFFIDPNTGFAFTTLGTGNGNVGIGTTTPRSTLHVNGQSAWLTGGNGGGLPTAAGSGLRLYHDGSRGMIFSFDYATASPRDLALQEPGGNVGIGTTTPAAKLDVRGNIKLGSSGQYAALGGQEDLRLLRGSIDGNGTIIAGAGFTSQRLSEGVYRITYTSSFSGLPTVTANAQRPGIGNLRWIFTYDHALNGVTMVSHFNGSDLTDTDFDFCVIGPR